MQSNLNNKNYLIITASGGNGLLLAAEALAQKIKKQNPEAKIIVKDTMLEWLRGCFGNFGVNTWNKSQKKGYKNIQELLVLCQRIAEFIFWPQIFFHVFKTLIKENIDYVIDTQPLVISAIIKAVRLYNKLSEKNVLVRRVIVDLPTKKTTHFFRGIKKLSKKDRKLISILTLEPLLKKNQTEEMFWKKYCGLTLDKVCYESYPVRQSFEKLESFQSKKGDYFIKINYENEKEKDLLFDIIKKGSIEFDHLDNFFQFKIKKDDFLITILLGSQPAFNGTLGYVNTLISFLNNTSIKRNIHVFTYCSTFKDQLFEKMQKMILQKELYPKNLSIIPMSFQQEKTIAELFFRSDLTITRSGGQTAVELLKVSKARFCVHTECRSKTASERKLLRGIPVWEAGSAEYMKKKMNASIINPEIFENYCQKLLLN